MLDDFVNWTLDHGRRGGVVMTVVGVVCLVLVALDIRVSGGFFVAIGAVGALFTLLGLLLTVVSRPTKQHFEPVESRPLDAETLALLRGTERPFLLCMACRKVTPFSPCMHCDRALDVTTVESDEDLELALAGMT